MTIHEKIWETLIKAGYETYLVGGAVRDMVMGRNPKDYDLATIATPDQIKEIFNNAKFVGESFGVCLVDGIEVATFRVDHSFGSAKDTKVEFTANIFEDLARRDFTMNAMALAYDGTIIDPFDGQKDIKNRIIKFVGHGDLRIAEDANRMIRACRFCTLGFTLEDYTKESIIFAVNAGAVKKITPERIRIEILKAMKMNTPSLFWSALLETGILKEVFPELVDAYGHDHGNYHEEDIWTHLMIAGDRVSSKFPLTRLAAFLHDVGKPASFDENTGSFHEHQHFGADIARTRLTSLKFSNEEIRHIVNLVLVHMDGTRRMSAKAVRRLKKKLHAYGLDWHDYVRVRIGDRAGNIARPDFTLSDIKAYVKHFTSENEIPFTTHHLAVSGAEIIKHFGLHPGPIVGKIQREMLKYVIEEGSGVNNKTDLINYINNILYSCENRDVVD
jgi:putative nucleotidyltransferase with HDIG domain